MPYLNYISDADLEAAVRYMLNSAADGLRRAQNEFTRNVIDPFSLVFEMAGFNILSVDSWERTEQTRQAQKSLVQAVGNFHQMVLGGVNGWDNLNVGGFVDLHCHQRQIIAEVKNKHNTVTGAKLVGVYDDLVGLVMPNASVFHGYTAYFVEIIPKGQQGYNAEFTPSDRATGIRRPTNPRIRKIDGNQFYELVTGIPGSLEALYDVLPAVITTVCGVRFAPLEIQKMKDYFRSAYTNN